ncbi:hypothetical protein GINT2_002043 [Glugoides intestinalis]
MSYTQRHDQITKIIEKIYPENLLESLSAIEYTLVHSTVEEGKALAPLEANFQLPNSFLRTRNSFDTERLFVNNNLENNWNSRLDRLIELLDDIEIEGTLMSQEEPIDEKMLEKLIKWRSGSQVNSKK